MNNNAKIIFEHIQSLNVRVSEISSFGRFIDRNNEMVTDSTWGEVWPLLPDGCLAKKILSDFMDKNPLYSQLSYKQLWVIAFELEKNEAYCKKVVDEHNELVRYEQYKKERSQAKKKANKETSDQVLKSIKDSGKLLKDYYAWLDTKGNPFRKEKYSKKFTQASANQFINL